MKKLLFAIGFMAFVMSANAQFVSLNKDELKQLKASIDKNEVYKKVYEPIVSSR